jgi:hypothetical protein
LLDRVEENKIKGGIRDEGRSWACIEENRPGKGEIKDIKTARVKRMSKRVCFLNQGRISGAGKVREDREWA